VRAGDEFRRNAGQRARAQAEPDDAGDLSRQAAGMSKIYDAIVLGLGPVGATLANLLAGQGLRIVVVDQREDVYDKPRAITLDHEVMRGMRACGIGDDPEPLTAPHPGTHYLGVDGRIIKIFDPLPPPFPLGWPPTGTFVQPQLERLLRERLRRSESCDWSL